VVGTEGKGAQLRRTGKEPLPQPQPHTQPHTDATRHTQPDTHTQHTHTHTRARVSVLTPGRAGRG
jgi:hypothetical protein